MGKAGESGDISKNLDRYMISPGFLREIIYRSKFLEISKEMYEHTLMHVYKIDIPSEHVF